MTSDVTVVLAHGAWADGSSWNDVISGLWAAGIASVAAPLPLTSLQDDVDALNRTIERIDGPVVLAAHAYAGGVIGSAHAGNVQALVYVAALAPDEGETVADVFTRAAPHPTAPAITPDAHGLVWLPAEAFPTAFAQNASAERHVLLNALQRPISAACITVPVGRPAWRDKPTWFLIAEEDHMIPVDTQRFMADRMGASTRSTRADHIPMITEPRPVIEMITDAVTAVTRTA
jgi:pimeloyl-ACP methyl ester carboxylesterase